MTIGGGLFWSAAVFVACVLGSATVGAAEFRRDPSRATTAGAVLEGKIEAGDFDKFKNFILNGADATEIYLASPGGDLAEAMKIGLLARILKLSTAVPSKTLTNQNRAAAVARHDLRDPKANYECASACFFIFVAGIHRSSDDSGPAILGIHRPSLSEGDLNKLNVDQAAAADDRTRRTIENYLRVMDVPAKYAEDMYTVPKRKILWIRNDEFETDFDGFIPEVRDLVRAKCGSKTRAEQSASEQSVSDMSTKKYETQLNCEKNVQGELALRAYSDARRRQSSDPLSLFGGTSAPQPK